MSSTPTGPERGRYIVRSDDPGKLAEFLDSIAGEPGTEVADLIGPVGAPHTAVVVMSHEKAAALEQRFRASGTSGTSNQLTIEPDRPLSLFGDA
jgi:hypothetical protein